MLEHVSLQIQVVRHLQISMVCQGDQGPVLRMHLILRYAQNAAVSSVLFYVAGVGLRLRAGGGERPGLHVPSLAGPEPQGSTSGNQSRTETRR